MHSLQEELLRRIQASQISAASRNREVVQSGPFRVMLNVNDDLIWLNYAVPTHNGFDHNAIEAMKEPFARYNRVPRLEFLEELWPELPAALEACGFELQSRLPAMVCTKSTFRGVSASTDLLESKILAPSDDIHAYLSIGMQAFEGKSEVTDPQVERQRESILKGPHRCAMAWFEGHPAAVALLMPEGGVAELAGVATLDRFRRKGLALAVSSVLLDEFFGSPQGDEAIAWLGAGDDTAKAVYEKLGFETLCTQANYILKKDA